MTSCQMCSSARCMTTPRVCSLYFKNFDKKLLKQRKDSESMDINTMLSAAYDAYEKVKMELVAATETIKELQDEIKTLKNNISALDSAKGHAESPVERTDS